MKKNATQVDCLHEFIHVLQWTSNSQESLTPIRRKAKYEKFHKILFVASDQVAGMKNVKKRDEFVKFIQSNIALLNDYAKLPSWLDEKDVYYFFYKICDVKIKCNSEDWDTLIANLFLFKDKLSWRLRNEITAKASNMVKQKELTGLKFVTFKTLSSSDTEEVRSLYQKNWPELIEYVRAKGIDLYQFVLSAPQKNEGILDPIPNEWLLKLKEPSNEILRSLLSFSKISQGYVLGKFLCSNDQKKENYIILTNNSSKEVLIHEYIHYLQSVKNPFFCEALTQQDKLMDDFRKGRLSRQEYESMVLKSKAIIWNAEYETYSFMVDHPSESHYEKSNNKIQKILYLARLKAWTDEFIEDAFRGERIHFTIKEDLPVVKILGRDLVLDLGAMNSVISPMLIFDQFNMDDLSLLKTVQLTNAKAEALEAPLVSIKAPVEIEKVSLKGTQWVLANLKLSFAEGVLGMNFFKTREFILYPKKGFLEFTTFIKKPSNALNLQRDYDGEIKALEMVCPGNSLIAHLDTGSQVLGDLKTSTKAQVRKELLSPKGYHCGKVVISGKFDSNVQNDTLFAHDVSLNLGWNWIKKFDRVSLSLKDGWILFK